MNGTGRPEVGETGPNELEWFNECFKWNFFESNSNFENMRFVENWDIKEGVMY
jgi:hypothetical protein